MRKNTILAFVICLLALLASAYSGQHSGEVAQSHATAASATNK